MTEQSPAAVAAAKTRALLAVGRLEEARKVAAEGLRSDPNNADLMGLLAAAFNRDGAEDSRHWAERSLSFDPQRAWVHNIRARAILDGAGQPPEAVESAYAAVNLDNGEASYRYTLTRALLSSKDRGGAENVARAIRGVDPASPLGPLAETLIELDRVRYFSPQKTSGWSWPIFGVVVAVFITNGLALIIVALWWLVVFVRRRRPLRRADRLLLEALRLDPVNPVAHRFAADVAGLRFRYVQSVNVTLATAAIDAGLVDANHLARTIILRTCMVAIASFISLFVVTATVSDTASVFAMTASGIVLGLIAAGVVVGLDHTQTRRLPAGVSRLVRRSWGLPATTTVIAAYAIYIGVTSLSRWHCVAVGALVFGGVMAAFAVTVIVKFIAARRMEWV